MKKYKFLSILFVLILSFACLVGCSSENLTVLGIVSDFDKKVSSLVYVDAEQVNSAILQLSSNNKYYFEFKPYDNVNLRQAVTKKTGSFAMLSNDSEYFALLNHASKYHSNSYTLSTLNVYSEKFENIPQEVLMEVDKSQSNFITALSNFQKQYKKLSDSYAYDSSNSQSTQFALTDLLKEYQNLISAEIDFSLSIQDMVDNYLFFDLSTYREDVTISYAEIYRLIDAYELYITDYLFQRYVVLENSKDESDYQLSFNDNELLVALNGLVDKMENFKQTNGETLLSNTETYKYLVLTEQSMRTRIAINRNSVKNLNGKIPAVSDSDYEYKNAIYQDLVDYQDTLLQLISKLDTLLA